MSLQTVQISMDIDANRARLFHKVHVVVSFPHNACLGVDFRREKLGFLPAAFGLFSTCKSIHMLWFI